MFDEIETERLRLRQWRAKDFQAYAAYYSDPELARFVGGHTTREAAWRRLAALIGHWSLRGYGYWAVEDQETGEFVGCVGLWRSEGWPELELGYWLVPAAHGRGYATEAGARARDYAWQTLGTESLVSYVDPENEPSKRVAERLGAEPEEVIELLDYGPHRVYRYPRPPDPADSADDPTDPADSADSGVVVRPARASDAGAMTRIYNHYVENTVVSFEEEPVTSAEIARRMAAVRASSLPWLVAEQEGAVFGYAYATHWRVRRAYRHSVEVTVYVRPDRHHHGIGSLLYGSLLDELPSLDVHLAIGGVALPNPASVALQEKFGFEKVAHFSEVGFKFGRWIDVGYWQRIL